LSSDSLCKDSIGTLRGLVKVCMSIITKQALKYELSFHDSKP